MNAYEEAKFDKWADDQFRKQRETPNGRNFLWNTFRFKDQFDIRKYRENMDKIFPNAPGAGM